MKFFAVALVLTGCATPAVLVDNWRGTGYQAIYADPGVVNEACYQPGAKLDDGTIHNWNGDWCGCVFYNTKKVYIARRIECDRKHTEDHEHNHIKEKEGK